MMAEGHERLRQPDCLYIDDVVMLPRGDCALWVGIDFENPEKVHVRGCMIVLGFVPPFFRRSRMRRFRDLAARVNRLRAVDRAMYPTSQPTAIETRVPTIEPIERGWRAHWPAQTAQGGDE